MQPAARGFAINKLATMRGVKQSTLDNIVRGLTRNARVKTLHKIALASNMTLANFSILTNSTSICSTTIRTKNNAAPAGGQMFLKRQQPAADRQKTVIILRTNASLYTRGPLALPRRYITRKSSV